MALSLPSILHWGRLIASMTIDWVENPPMDKVKKDPGCVELLRTSGCPSGDDPSVDELPLLLEDREER